MRARFRVGLSAAAALPVDSKAPPTGHLAGSSTHRPSLPSPLRLLPLCRRVLGELHGPSLCAEPLRVGSRQRGRHAGCCLLLLCAAGPDSVTDPLQRCLSVEAGNPGGTAGPQPSHSAFRGCCGGCMRHLLPHSGSACLSCGWHGAPSGQLFTHVQQSHRCVPALCCLLIRRQILLPLPHPLCQGRFSIGCLDADPCTLSYPPIELRFDAMNSCKVILKWTRD